jgi:hypothetical protein
MIGFLDATAARLAPRAPSLLQVASSMGRDAVESMTLSHEVSALVYPLSDTAEKIKQSGLMISQGEEFLFGVLLALTFPGGVPQFETARAETKAALRGWLWDGELATPVAYAGGALVHYSAVQGGKLLWLLRFTCSFRDTYEVMP